MVDGQPRVLLREGADLKVLREEGIHALQILDPRLRGKVALLDEALMGQWDRLPLDTKLAMYRAKLDLEVDAHHTMVAGLRDQIAQTPPGPTRDALVEELADAGTNLRNLATRLDELHGFGPLDRLRARFGVGRLAERLDQPPRLFRKGTGTTTRPRTKPRPPLRKDRTDIELQKQSKTAKRHPLSKREASPQQKKKDVLKVERVGDEWREVSWRGEFRDKPGIDRYRIVEVTDKRGRKVRIEETVRRGSRPPKWVKRGREASFEGMVAEEASLATTRGLIEEARAKGETIVSLGPLQTSSGHGFDEVYIHFDINGRPEIRIVEVKTYPNRWVPLEDFTAVTRNLSDNLERLRKLVFLPPIQRPAALRGLDPEKLAALRKLFPRPGQKLSPRRGGHP